MLKNIALAVGLVFSWLWVEVFPVGAQRPVHLPETAPSWIGPVFVTGSWLTHPDIDDAGLQMVAIDTGSGTEDNAKDVVLSQYDNGSWNQPVILASNAFYSSSFFQDPPRDTFPVISGDGETIAYLGYEAANEGYHLFIIDKVAGVWGSPYVYNGWDGCVDNELDISQDGDTIVFSNCPSMFSTMRVFIARRIGGVWQPYLIVSGDGPYVGGAQGSISADGRKIVYQSSTHIYFVELLADGSWTKPLNLTQCYFDAYASAYYLYHPKLSPDGNAAFFWRYDEDSSSGQTVVKYMTLYAMRRYGGSWSPPVPISGAPITPDLVTGSPPAVDQSGTRVIFSRRLWGDPFTGSRLDLTEFTNGRWTMPVPLTSQYEAQYPNLSADGRQVAFYHRNEQDLGTASLSTPDLSPGYAYSANQATISPAGGSFAADLHTTVTFASGTFSQTVQVSFTRLPGVALPSAGNERMNIGWGFDLAALNAATHMPAGVDPAHPYTIVVDYSDGPTAVDPASYKLYAWQPEVSSWMPLDSQLQSQSQLLTASGVDHLGLFAVHAATTPLFLPALLR